MNINKFNFFLALSIILLPTISLKAQPIFNYTDFAPLTGDQYSVGHSPNYFAGSAGANQTWNFATATIATNEIYNVVTATTVPCGNVYPSASQAIGTTSYSMIDVTASEYLGYGKTYTPGWAGFIYSNPEKMFSFPMSFANSFTDHYEGSEYNTPLYRQGDATVTYVGYGTIITPYGTYPNAICIHRQFTESDTTPNGGSICNTDAYYWFAAGYRYPVAESWYQPATSSCGSTGGGTLFLQSITSGSEEMYSNDALNIFPNPFVTEVTIKTADPKRANLLTISDLTGRTILTYQFTSDQLTINLADLVDGVYILRINEGKGLKVIKIGIANQY